MPRRPATAARRCAAHPGARLAALLACAAILVGPAQAGAGEGGRGGLHLDEGTARSARSDPGEGWRARGVVFLDLPFGLRARYDAQALHRRAPSDPLGADLDGLADRRRFFGPLDLADPASAPDAAAPPGSRLLESRFALSRALLPRLELELAWAARSPLAMVDLLRIEDRRVTAMIRFVP